MARHRDSPGADAPAIAAIATPKGDRATPSAPSTSHSEDNCPVGSIRVPCARSPWDKGAGTPPIANGAPLAARAGSTPDGTWAGVGARQRISAPVPSRRPGMTSATTTTAAAPPAREDALPRHGVPCSSDKESSARRTETHDRARRKHGHDTDTAGIQR